ncbi:hypothetical protein OPQ81_002719 [Rhizoctonia solani]|nr:hypothetical protein OPQ81_002719 [Rhizoctonia solani]
MPRLCVGIFAAAAAAVSNVDVTVYGAGDQATYTPTTTTAEAASYTGSAAYDPAVLAPPTPPAQFNREFVIPLRQGDPEGASVPVPGSYVGFSNELSVANRAIGTNSSVLAVASLSHIVYIFNRAGAVQVRVGGNTQEQDILRPEGFPGGEILIKAHEDTTTTRTPHIEFGPYLFKVLANVVSLVKTEIYLGLNFVDIIEPSGLCRHGRGNVGLKPHGIVLGNEPDLYDLPGHMKRPEP